MASRVNNESDKSWANLTVSDFVHDTDKGIVMPNATPQNLQELQDRIVILEKVIAEYAVRYGLTDAARTAMITPKRLDG